MGFVVQSRCSGRQVCRYFKTHRSSFRYQAKEPDAWQKHLRSREVLFTEAQSLGLSQDHPAVASRWLDGGKAYGSAHMPGTEAACTKANAQTE